MVTLWFWLVAFMLVMYIILDGFDLGAGVLYPFVARDEDERLAVLKAIGPVWDGNEVWLIAAGGSLFFAFPLLYATSFSGFYLPLMLVLWLLMIRGVALEVRSHLVERVWREFWSGAFFLGSALLAFVFGVAAGNVVRGVPLGPDGTFFATFWTTWLPTAAVPGVLDLYTVPVGLLTLAALAWHGGNWVVLKTEGAVADRCHRAARIAWGLTVALTVGVTLYTFLLHPDYWANYGRWPLGLALPALALGSLAAGGVTLAQRREWPMFLASSGYLGGMLAATAFALYPRVLPATDPARSLTAFQAAASEAGLRIGLVWWAIGMALALGYVIGIYWLFRGKVQPGEYHG